MVTPIILGFNDNGNIISIYEITKYSFFYIHINHRLDPFHRIMYDFTVRYIEKSALIQIQLIGVTFVEEHPTPIHIRLVHCKYSDMDPTLVIGYIFNYKKYYTENYSIVGFHTFIKNNIGLLIEYLGLDYLYPDTPIYLETDMFEKSQLLSSTTSHYDVEFKQTRNGEHLYKMKI